MPSKYHISQKEFDEILRKATPDKNKCLFPNCKAEKQDIDLIIKKGEKEYGVCETHWDMIGRSDIDI